MPPIIRLLRPKQWSKNLLVFAAITFTGRFNDSASLILAIGAFVGMCLLSSAVYIANDLRDIERDRSHPRKRLRPIAAGLVAPRVGVLVCVVLAIAAFGLLVRFGGAFGWMIGLVYVAMQVVYNVGVKRVPIADVFLISMGFVLRAVLGASAIDVKISTWLVLCTGALALMLGFAKRRHEFLLQGDNRTASRESLAGYSKASLDALVIVAAATACINYSIYCVESETARKYPAILMTALFVFYGIGRYLLLVFHDDEGGEPADLLFGDPHLIASVVLFAVSAGVALSGVNLPLLEGR